MRGRCAPVARARPGRQEVSSTCELRFTIYAPPLQPSRLRLPPISVHVYNPVVMTRSSKPSSICRLACFAALFFLFSIFPFPFSSPAQQELELRARARIYPGLGPGVTALKRDAAGRYFVLVALPAGQGSVVRAYNAEGQRVAQFPADAAGPAAPAPVVAWPRQGTATQTPAAPSKTPGIIFADDFDLDDEGRVFVADRGANAVKIFGPDGKLERSFAVSAPASVVALPESEIAVTTMRPEKLVQVFGPTGKLLREFGDLIDVAERPDLNRFLNIGRFATDPDRHLYCAFTNLPEPTLRKYDRFGYALMEIELNTIDFLPTARAARREIQRQDERGGTPAIKPTIRAVAVDPDTRHVWLGVGGLLVHCGSDGARLNTYRIFTAEGVRLEPVAILVERDRILVAADPLGIYEFPRPDKPAAR